MDFLYENKMKAEGYGFICGIDEAGRGPLAGPVCAAAVILPQGADIPGLDDSKKVSPKKREKLFDVITKTAVAYGVGWANEDEIDSVNILNASFLAMKRAVWQLGTKPDCALVDGNRNPKLDIPTLCIIKGDAKCPSIAAASILAKVSRDRYMLKLDESYPQYGFAKHKGYPTKLHYEMILKYGISPVHRKTFLKNLDEKAALYGNFNR
jgi:ribonuclease HII